MALTLSSKGFTKLATRSTKTFMGHQKRTLVVEAMTGHALGAIGGVVLPRFVGEDLMKKVSMANVTDPVMIGAAGGSILGTTLFTLATCGGEVGVVGSVFLAAAGIGGQAGGVILHETNAMPFSLTNPFDKKGVVTSMVVGGTFAVGVTSLCLV